MSPRLIITADDYGLSKYNVDTILEASLGALTNLSALANGEAIEYAVREYVQKAAQLSFSMHLNLTEGKPVSLDPLVISILADREGKFRFSVGTLLISYICSLPKKRAHYREAVRKEISAQFERIQKLLDPYGLFIAGADGHQHVHMIPFVFDALIEEKKIPYIRVTSEPWYVVGNQLSIFFILRFFVNILLRILSIRNTDRANHRGVKTSRFFLGFMFSGRMTYESVAAGLSAILKKQTIDDITEACFHPGNATPRELVSWTNADQEWHYSSSRVYERTLLSDSNFIKLCQTFRLSPLPEMDNHTS